MMEKNPIEKELEKTKEDLVMADLKLRFWTNKYSIENTQEALQTSAQLTKTKQLLIEWEKFLDEELKKKKV